MQFKELDKIVPKATGKPDLVWRDSTAATKGCWRNGHVEGRFWRGDAEMRRKRRIAPAT